VTPIAPYAACGSHVQVRHRQRVLLDPSIARAAEELEIGLSGTLAENTREEVHAFELLDRTTILPSEGATDGRRLYHEAWLMQGVSQIQSKNYKAALTSINTARDWPEKMGSGKPYDDDIDGRMENYLDGICYEKTKNQDQATRKWNEIISYTNSVNNVNNVNNVNTLITALALRKTNRNEEGEKLLSEWIQKEPDSKLARWCNEVYHRKRPVNDVEGDTYFRIIKALLFIN